MRKRSNEGIMASKNDFSKLLAEGSTNLVAAIIFCFALVLGAYAQNPVSWSLNSAKSAKGGGKFEARLTANISSGWYLYSLTQPSGGPNATRITVASEQAFKLAGGVKAPPPKVKFDENFGINTETFAGNVTFTIPLQAAANAAPGRQTLGINVRFQVCNETTCLPPRTVKVETPVEIAPGSAAEVKNANASPPVVSSTVNPTPKPIPTSTPQTAATPPANLSTDKLQPENGFITPENKGGENDDPP